MPNENGNNEIVRRVAFRITGVFEAPSYSTIQIIDSGIISYGQHQATLASGTLEIILKRYCDSCDSKTAKALKKFLSRVAAKDASLKKDQKFLDLLRAAGAEEAMIDAQDSVFIEKYWLPAVAKAAAENVKSPLGLAIFYDTLVQGGLDNTIERVRKKLGNVSVAEQKYLKTFLECRRERLLEIAEKQLKSTNATTRTNGKMLKNSAKTRIGALMNLVEANNLELLGKFDINGKMIEGIDGASIPTPTPPKILKRGDVNDDVKLLQDGFVALGYMRTDKIGTGYGTFGPQTQAAVEAFQKDLGLKATGEFGEAEQKVLKAVEDGIGKGSPHKQIVKAIQDRLVKLGFMTQAQVNTGYGTFGNQTERAVKAFQSEHQLQQSGVVESVTFKMLFNEPAAETASGEEFFEAKSGENYTVLTGILITKSLEKKIKKLADIYFAKRKTKLVITSGYRPPERQASAMYDKIVREGELSVRKLYKNKAAVDQILNAYRANKGKREAAIKAMTETIAKQVKSGIYISNHLRSNALDVRMTANLKALNEAVMQIGGRIVVESDHYHLELH